MPIRISYSSNDEPVSLSEARLAARIDGNDLDAFIAVAITAAREAAEHITGRAYRRQVLREELQDWPSAQSAIAVHQASECAVRYWTGIDWSDPLPDADFTFAPGGIGRNGTVLAPASVWPTLGVRAIGPRVRIDLTAGPDSTADVPAAVKLYIQANVAAWIDNPQALTSKTLEVSPLLARLLDAERLWG